MRDKKRGPGAIQLPVLMLLFSEDHQIETFTLPSL